jgi:hypothetical protein
MQAMNSFPVSSASADFCNRSIPCITLAQPSSRSTTNAKSTEFCATGSDRLKAPARSWIAQANHGDPGVLAWGSGFCAVLPDSCAMWNVFPALPCWASMFRAPRWFAASPHQNSPPLSFRAQRGIPIPTRALPRCHPERSEGSMHLPLPLLLPLPFTHNSQLTTEVDPSPPPRQLCFQQLTRGATSKYLSRRHLHVKTCYQRT